MPSSSGTTGQESLIATKLNPSEFDSRLISRRAILDGFLSGGRRRSVLSIVASAGSGKSTLMAELHRTFAEREAKTCWLSLDSDDNSPAAFAVYFISALRSIDPTFAEIELAQLRCNPVHDFTALTNRLIRKISTVSSDTAIFLDDFQHITDS